MKRLQILLLLLLLVPLSAIAQRTDLTGLKFCIDPGHGGYNAANDRHVIPDPGIDFWESESNFEKALLLKTLLEQQGATVILTRYTNDYPTDAEPTLAERVAVANNNNVDFFHSIHSNATGLALNTSINTTLMLVREKRPGGPASGTGNGLGIPETDAALQMATALSPAIKAVLRTQSSSTWLDWTFYGGTNGGFSLGVLRGLNMPGELSEGSMHDFYPETRRLMNNDYHKMEMYAIRNTFMQFYGVPADQQSIIAGIQWDLATGNPVNYSSVRLLPENIVKTGDNYNNGFFMFDSLTPGLHTIRFETPGYSPDSVQITTTSGAVSFVDRNLIAAGLPKVLVSSPVEGDTAFAMNQPVVVRFNKPMDTASVRSAMTLSPAVSGTLGWNVVNSQFSYTPTGVFPYGVSYTLTIDTTARSIDGNRIDGTGAGTGSAPFALHFKTRYVDIIPPRLVARYPDSTGTAWGGSQMISLTFDDIVDPSSIVISNVALQQIGGSVLSRTVQSWTAGGRTGINVYPNAPLVSPASFRVRVSGFKDLLGNVISTTNPILWTFTTSGTPVSTKTLDDFSAGVTHWKQPLDAPETTGVDSASFAAATGFALNLPGGIPGSGLLRVAWTRGASNAFLRIMCDSATGAQQSLSLATATVLQAYVLGDGKGTQFRFAAKADIGGLASRWYTIDWIGWRLVQWHLTVDSAFAWNGSKWNTGQAHFDSFEFRPSATDTSATTFAVVAMPQAMMLMGPDGVAEQSSGLPATFRLHDAFPNPFNPSTTLKYDMPSDGVVSLVVYDLIGREVAVLADGTQAAGIHTATWQPQAAASGVYFVRLRVNSLAGHKDYSRTIKLLLVK